MPIIEAKNITKIFVNTTKVLDDVSISINSGDFLSIQGASGSGKSTLLTILAGIDKPTSGRVVIDGLDISGLKEKDLAVLRRSKIGYVFQFFNLAPYLTAKENIMLPILLNHKRTKLYEQKVENIMDKLGIKQCSDRLPATMSGGEQQRVAIARGLIFEPEVILLDEPTGNLDSQNSMEIMELLKMINQDFGTTIVQVTHSRENALYGNRIIQIKDGKILDDNITE